MTIELVDLERGQRRTAVTNRGGFFAEVSQQILGAYVQDSWSPNRRLTLQVGARWDGTVNPGPWRTGRSRR